MRGGGWAFNCLGGISCERHFEFNLGLRWSFNLMPFDSSFSL